MANLIHYVCFGYHFFWMKGKPKFLVHMLLVKGVLIVPLEEQHRQSSCVGIPCCI